MTPEQMERFKLVKTPGPTVNLPEQVMQAGEEAIEVGVDVVSEGLGRSQSYMQSNIPANMKGKRQVPQITKQQLEEQKMNEAQGLPSNLNEASRVVELEKTVSNLNSNMAKITDLLEKALKPMGMNPTSAALNLMQAPVAQPLTPPASPAELPLELVEVMPQGLESQVARVSIPSVLATESLTPEVGSPTSPPVSFQPLSPPLDSPETKGPETVTSLDEMPGRYFRQVQTPGGVVTEELDENKQPIAPVTLGPTGSTGPEPQPDRFEITEESSPGEVGQVTEESVEPAVDVDEMKRLSRQQMLTTQVTEWLGSKDTHKFWKRFLSSACNKNLSYNTWPPEFQGPFDVKFKEMVSDPSFVSVICGRIIKMQMGHLVSPHVAGAFVVVTAGFLSFALLDQ